MFDMGSLNGLNGGMNESMIFNQNINSSNLNNNKLADNFI